MDPHICQTMKSTRLAQNKQSMLTLMIFLLLEGHNHYMAHSEEVEVLQNCKDYFKSSWEKKEDVQSKEKKPYKSYLRWLSDLCQLTYTSFRPEDITLGS